MSLDEKFNAAAEKLKTFTKRPTDEEFLEIYALFKQGTFGDNDTEKPGLFDLKAKYKWNSWNDKKGITKDAAKEKYIAFIDELATKYL